MSFDKKTKSTSRTFAKGTNNEVILKYVHDSINNTQSDFVMHLASTRHKYVVTVTRFIEEGEEQNG